MSKAASFFACFLFVFCFSLTASAAVYTVTKTADTSDGTCDADCSLREAIAAANATPDNDTIEFSSLFSSTQTITLANGELVVAANGSLTINGPGPEFLTISGNNASRILSSGANVVVNINNLRFTAGNGAGTLNTGRGGAIYNVGGTMVITNSVLTGNTAANGGAINNAASTNPSVAANLTIINCSITNNSSTSSGAAMQNFSTSTLHLRNTTVANNTSSGTGIAGAFQANGTVTITNSTFSGNSAPAGTGGGVYFNGTSMIMTNTTIVNNSSGVGGGGLHRTGTNPTANVRNSIIANNNGAAATPDVLGAITSQGNNIIGNIGTSTGWVASDLQNVNPQLGALAANGGLGQTHLPLAGSPAIDAGQNCVVDLTCSAANPPVAVTTDQRGVTRPQNAVVDIGAVEVAAVSLVTVSGKVFDSAGSPVKGAIVSLTDSGNVTRYTKTNSFGAFTFANVPFGASYTLSANAKGLIFNGIVFNTDASPTNINLFALNSNLSEFEK
jgi:CSLREA domain-containing protein